MRAELEYPISQIEVVVDVVVVDMYRLYQSILLSLLTHVGNMYVGSLRSLPSEMSSSPNKMNGSASRWLLNVTCQSERLAMP